jgi:hypothetical protein
MANIRDISTNRQIHINEAYNPRLQTTKFRKGHLLADCCNLKTFQLLILNKMFKCPMYLDSLNYTRRIISPRFKFWLFSNLELCYTCLLMGFNYNQSEQATIYCFQRFIKLCLLFWARAYFHSNSLSQLGSMRQTRKWTLV